MTKYYSVNRKKQTIEVGIENRLSVRAHTIVFYSIHRLFNIDVLNLKSHDFMTGMHYFFAPKAPMSDKEWEEKEEEICSEMDIGIKRGFKFLTNVDGNEVIDKLAVDADDRTLPLLERYIKTETIPTMEEYEEMLRNK